MNRIKILAVALTATVMLACNNQPEQKKTENPVDAAAAPDSGGKFETMMIKSLKNCPLCATPLLPLR